MGFTDGYFRKQPAFLPHLDDIPSGQLSYIVVIPAYCENNLIAALESLWKCTRPAGHVEVIIVINAPEDAGDSIHATCRRYLTDARRWISVHRDPAFRFLLMEALNMPAKHAGVGLARRTGMDEAAFRFDRIGMRNGWILSYDADCQCDSNYFIAIEDHITRYPGARGFNLYFEHPVSGNEFSERVYRGIAEYELHLRYMNQFLRLAGFPYAFHTVGSSFAVKAQDYILQGGMSRRKAGEDFYFLHKIIPLGGFYEINDIRVIPSPRLSDRVPFGTGAAISKFMASGEDHLLTYAPASFLDLQDLFLKVPQFFKSGDQKIGKVIDSLAPPLAEYMRSLDATAAIANVSANCASAASFINRFYRWFDAFRVMQYLNRSNKSYYGYVRVTEAAMRFLMLLGKEIPADSGPLDLLRIMRSAERSQEFFTPHPQ